MMAKIWVPMFLFLLFPQHHAWADLYQYVDKNGVVHMTDSMDKAPPDQSASARSQQNASSVSRQQSTTPQAAEADSRIAADLEQDGCEIQLKENARTCRHYLQNGSTYRGKNFDPDTFLVGMGRLCSNPLLQDVLTTEEQVQIRKIVLHAKAVEARLTKKQRYEAAMMTAYFSPRCGREEEKKVEKVFSQHELDSLSVTLQKIWKDMSAALAANDIEKAVSYYWVPMQDEWRRRLASFSEENRRSIGRDFMGAQVHVERVEGGGRAVCYLVIPRGGRKDAGQLIFVQGLDGEWLIEQY